MSNIVELLFKLIKSAMSGTAIDGEVSLSEEQEKKLYALAQTHDMAHLVSYGLDKNKIQLKSGEIAEKFKRQQLLAGFRYEQQNYEYEQVRALLHSLEIPFVPLKGAVIRPMYPEPWMRTSCDIDILVRESDIPKARDALQKTLGYSFDGVGDHDLGFSTSGGVHFELHFSLLDNKNEDKYLKNVWKYVSAKEAESFEYVMPEELFYYYHIQHMAKHFVNGGCGIKPFLDLWVFSQNGLSLNGLDPSSLKKSNLYCFAEKSEKLARIWFGEEAHDPLSRNMQTFVLSGGVYGSAQNKQAAKKKKNQSMLQYYLSRIWLPTSVMKVRYPSLGKHVYLLPFYQIRRWGEIVFSRRSDSHAEPESSNVSDTAEKFALDLMKDLRL